MITKEYLTKRLEEYELQHQQLVANANAAQGAIQACERMLKDLAKQEAENDGQEGSD